jgi:hypothetical protein
MNSKQGVLTAHEFKAANKSYNVPVVLSLSSVIVINLPVKIEYNCTICKAAFKYGEC